MRNVRQRAKPYPDEKGIIVYQVPRQLKGHSCFFPKFSTFFRALFQSSIPGTWYIFSCYFFPNIGMLNELDILGSGEFTNSDRTPPYIDTYLRLFPNF